MTSAMPSATLGFVDRVEEMKRILDALKVASEGNGQLLLVRGEAGSGKTRLLEEGATEAEKQGFTIGFGTALAESVVPYHAWKEVLEGLGLETILEEAPPPKLLGLYLIASDGGIRVKVEREGMDTGLAPLVDMIAESVRKSESQQENAEVETSSHDGYRSVVERRPDSSLGAIVEGREDEAFLEDLNELADTLESMLGDPQQAGADDTIEVPMRELLESEKYEGIDYTKDNPKLRQVKLFEHVTLGLSRKARGRFLCVAIDDLQWADPSSLALLQYVSRNLRKSGILLLGAYRREDAEARPHLKDALKEMEQEGLLAEMDLKGLSREDLADLAESFVGSHDLGDNLLDLLWQETQGNPLFVREVLRGLEDDESIAVQGAVKRLVRPLDELALPDRVREVIRARLDRLPIGDRRLLDAAATCGTRFTLGLVAKVAGETERNALNGLREIAEVHGLLRSTADGFAFDHSAIQEVLYDDMTQDARRAYHRGAGEWLELAGGPVEDIAEHYYRSQDGRKALTYLLQAAENATRQYSNAEAIRFYSEALELETDGRDRVEILEGLGFVHDRIGEYEGAVEWYKQGLELTTNKNKKADLLAKIGGICIFTGELDEAISLCNEAMELEGGEHSRVEAGVLHNLGFAYYEKGEYQRALEYYEKGVTIAEAVGDVDFMANGLNNIGSVYGDQGNPDKAIEYYEKSLAIRKETGDQSGLAGSMHNLGVEYAGKGDYDRALELYSKSVEISDRTGNMSILATHFWGIGDVHWHRGEFDEALGYFRKNLEIRERTGESQGKAGALNAIGDVYTDLGDYKRALELYQEALGICERIGYQYYLANNLKDIGHVHANQGDYDVALDYLMRSVSLYKKMGTHWGLSDAYCCIAEAYVGKKDFARATDSFRSALSSSEKANRTENIGRAHRILGIISREQGLWEEAARNFIESLRIYQSIGKKVDIGRAHYEFGVMYRQQGNKGKAAEHLDSAIEVFEGLDLKADTEKAVAALKGI